MTAPYTPINCSYYDELEALATLSREVKIDFYPHGSATPSQIYGTISTFVIQEGAEFLVLNSGEKIRLDWLISVDGKTVPAAC